MACFGTTDTKPAFRHFLCKNWLKLTGGCASRSSILEPCGLLMQTVAGSKDRFRMDNVGSNWPLYQLSYLGARTRPGRMRVNVGLYGVSRRSANMSNV